MSEAFPGNPSAEDVQERVQKLQEETNLGEGNDEPDPATSDNPPRRSEQGNREREQH